MAMWKYLKGSEKDFEGAPDWASVVFGMYGNAHGFAEDWEKGARYVFPTKGQECCQWEDTLNKWYDLGTVIAQRERVTSVNDDRLAQDLRIGSGIAPGVHSNDVITERASKYHREIKPGVWVDVYDVLVAWSVTNPALQHLIKKALQPGERGHKDAEQDLQDILHSAKRAIELNGVKK